MAYGKTPSRARRIVKRVLLILLLLISVAALGAGGFAVYAVSRAPALDLSDVVPDGYRTTVLDSEGNTMLTLVGEESNRVYVTLDEMPDNLLGAFVAIEDARFWSHHGVDLRAVVRAAWKDLTAGGLAEGASTITQQLIKNNVLTGWTQEETAADKITRKLQEQYLAIQLEQNRSKEWILENYLNTINLGGGAWGVETASLRYFGKDVSQLTLSECAVLAAIPQSPSAYDPVSHPEANATRRQAVLDRMLEQGLITPSAYGKAAEDDVYARISRRSASGEAQVFSWFEDAMLAQVAADLQEELHCPEDEAWDLIYRGGLTIVTTQDTALQRICEQAVNNDSLYTTDAQSTVVLIDNATGQVRAIVGGRGEKTVSLAFNRAVDSVRQPGSTIKVIGEYAAAIERGYATLGTVFDDAPSTYTNGTPVYNASGTYAGMTTLRTAIENSVNVVALKCFREIGMNAVWHSLESFGLSHLGTEDKVEALALGGTYGGVTNLEMTAAYAAIANTGVYNEPLFYTRIIDHDGSVLLDRSPESHRAVSARTAALLTDAMTGVITRGTGTAAAFEGSELAGKSGTTTDARDAWFVGFSPDFTCGVWGGYDDNSAQSGSTYVKQIWKSVMQQAQIYCTRREFEAAEGLVSREICLKCGKLAVDGLCESTVQGDETRLEYFVSGTEPKEKCGCHVAVELCTDSGLPAGRWCPAASRETRVYLTRGTNGTADAAAVNPYGEDVSCTTHTSIFDRLFPNGKDTGGNTEKDGGEAPGYGPGYGSDRRDDGRGDRDRDGNSGGSWWDGFLDLFQ